MSASLLNHYGRAPLAILLYASIFLLPWWPGAPTFANERQAIQSNQTQFEFDIAAQPLETALRQYIQTTGLNVLVDSNLTSRQHSPGAQGSFTAEQALRQLIIHSGLDAHYASSRTFTLMPRAQQHKPAQPITPATLEASEFVTAFQSSLEKVICHSFLLPEGDYRMLLQVWLSPRSTVDTIRLVKPTDDPTRDRQVLDAVRSLRFPPSSGRLPQPITLLLLPNNISSGCPA
ncbi:hypothetical protein SAMN05216198_1397 [Halopseudomonas litoralis]|uniref:Secretin/TonB short N-terminal domain-containing protein n=1 Tax=Halopseudomonas litoralis TaxID=797277 RepID=A0A1H1Q738_9GAMM|nr:hypothetical protein [Halopseudomonas litoralis]SDS19087.1 hypothetical protein SAMN05216198_1397 [Halopseudomonas litoralis]